MDYEERKAYAEQVCAEGMKRVATTLPPVEQKFKPGTRVLIALDLGPYMKHFPGAGYFATVLYTHAHAYQSKSFKSYALDIDGLGEVSWYDEDQLTEVGEHVLAQTKEQQEVFRKLTNGCRMLEQLIDVLREEHPMRPLIAEQISKLRGCVE